MQFAKMNNAIRNAVLSLVGLAAISVLAHNFSGAATTTSTAPARHYYLTKTTITGDKALTACASGYHFASFVEMMDPAVLTYNKALGRSLADDGAGPPSGPGAFGWVRSGYSSNAALPNGPESGLPTNCNLWTSGATTDYGEGAALIPSYYNGTSWIPSIAYADNIGCDGTAASQQINIGVWCVEN
jgi:hypothetical protein